MDSRQFLLHSLAAAALANPIFAPAQTPLPQFVQQVVDSERAANQNDHSNWLYLDDFRKPNDHVLQWVASTQHGDVNRILLKSDQRLAEADQRDRIQAFLRDPHAQKKQLVENAHDNQQVDDFLKLLPAAFLWSETKATAVDTFLHFEPDPAFHPPTREARVFSAMAGDLIVDNQQRRIRSMSGHLLHDVTFGGGLLGRLKQGSSFALEQSQVEAQPGNSIWQLSALHVHLQGNALLFKSVSLEQDDERTHFIPEAPTVTLDQAAANLMAQPADPAPPLLAH